MSIAIHNATLLAAARRKIGLLVLLLVWLTSWALAHGYQGIHHDAILYTLQALARLGSGRLSDDVFLQLGSQDRYTIFGWIHALAIRCFGVEPAAQILTLVSQLALILCAAVLLHRVAPTRALMAQGISVLIAIPGFYGADRIFSCIEPFVTPRMGAEALVLAALGAAWNARPMLAWVLVGVALLIHPVMAMAGLVALGFYYVGRRQPRLTLIIVVGGLLLLMVGAQIAPGRPPWGTFDPAWLSAVRERSPYVFLAHWSLDDWGYAAVPLATLAVGAVLLVERGARLLCQVILCTALTGLTLTWVACDVSKLVLLTQLQPWRWQWLGVVTAALLIPSIAVNGWQRSNVGKITAALLVSSWLCGSGELALATGAAAVVTLGLEKYSARPELRLLVYGASALVVGALVNRIASNLLFLDAHYSSTQIPWWIREMSSLTGDGSVPVAVTVLVTWLAGKERGSVPLAVLGVMAAGLCVALFPDAWRRWTQQRFPPTLIAQFAPWRALIPAGTAVFWPESPLESWVLLQRPSYISVAQSSGMLFSRDTTLELQRRAIALSSVIAPQAYLSFSGEGTGIGPASDQLARACATAEFDFLVTGARLPWQPLAQLPPQVWHSSGGLRLYRCSDRTG